MIELIDNSVWVFPVEVHYRYLSKKPTRKFLLETKIPDLSRNNQAFYAVSGLVYTLASELVFRYMGHIQRMSRGPPKLDKMAFNVSFSAPWSLDVKTDYYYGCEYRVRHTTDISWQDDFLRSLGKRIQSEVEILEIIRACNEGVKRRVQERLEKSA